MSTSSHRFASFFVAIAVSLLVLAPSRAEVSPDPEDLHRVVATIQKLSASLQGQLDGVTDSIERSHRIREAVRQDIVESIDLELCAEVAIVSSISLSVSRAGSDEEAIYEVVYMEIVRRLGDDGRPGARSELQEIRSKLRVDGASALVLHEAFKKQGMTW